MIVLLWALTLFNFAVAMGGITVARKLMTREERAHWRSKTLLRIADAFAWILPLAAIAGTALAWIDVRNGHPAGALLGFIPIGWLFLMGIVFAVVDYAEDGILGNAREP
jgi:Ca2+/H+ antiporter